MFEVFDHTADLGLRVRAGDLEELFVEAARALFSVIVANPVDVQPLQVKPIHVEGTDNQQDFLLFDWLSELLYTFETERLLLCEFNLSFDIVGLRAECRGETADPERHELEHEIKAITYHGLKLCQENGAWLAEFIVDI